MDLLIYFERERERERERECSCTYVRTYYSGIQFRIFHVWESETENVLSGIIYIYIYIYIYVCVCVCILTAIGFISGDRIAWCRSRAITISMLVLAIIEKLCVNLINLHIKAPASQSLSTYSQISWGRQPNKITNKSATERFKMKRLTLDFQRRFNFIHKSIRKVPIEPIIIITYRLINLIAFE